MEHGIISVKQLRKTYLLFALFINVLVTMYMIINDFYIVPCGVFAQHGILKTKLEASSKRTSSNPLSYLQLQHVYHYA